jgi:NADH-quinone oxidoreductase subunit K
MIPISWYLALSVVLFTIGAVGVVVKRNVISMMLAIELMLNSVNLMVVAAAEAGVGLAIVVLLFRNRETMNVDEASMLKL